MISIPVSDIKLFMNQLFLSEYFDSFLLSEAFFVTFSTFHIDGTFHPSYYSSEELEASGMAQTKYAYWKQMRPFCLSLIKGTHTPLEFRIVFRLSPSNIERLLTDQGITAFSVQDIDGLFLNLHYSEGSLRCTTGTSLTIFSLDKSLEHVWDDKVQKFLSRFY